MLSGIRKYGVSLTLANQYIDQLAEPLRAALFGTVGTIVAFRIGVRDAPFVAPELSIKEADLLDLKAHSALVRSVGKTISISVPLPSSIAYPAGPRRVIARNRAECATQRSLAETQLAHFL